MSNYTLSNKKNLDTFPISHVFVEKYMPQANATFVKIYLYALHHCYYGNSSLTHELIAQTLNILESDVINAWRYWEKQKVVKLYTYNKDYSNAFDVEFIDLSSVSNNLESNIYNQSSISNMQPNSTINASTQSRPPVLSSRPHYSEDEIATYLQTDNGIKTMYQVAQQTLGKLISSNDISILYSFYDWLRMPVEVIIMLLKYCASVGKKNMRYIEKIALDWSDLGLDSIEKVEVHLKSLEVQNSFIYQVQKIMGIHERTLGDSERKYIMTWQTEFSQDISLIRYAYDITVMNTGKLSFPYMHKILKSWHETNIKTVEIAMEEYKNKQIASKSPYERKENSYLSGSNKLGKPTTALKNNKFNNFKQRDIDFNELERLARQKVLDNLKKDGNNNVS